MSESIFIIRLRNAGIGYSGIPVLAPLDVDVERGSFMILSGPNGGGKTTLLKSMGGLLPILTGSCSNKGARIGYVPQQDALDSAFPMTAQEWVEDGVAASLPWWKPMTSRDRHHGLDCLKKCRADAYARRLFRELSCGQRQRVLLARALATRPNILLLDEPTSGIDRDTQSILIELLVHLRETEGMTVVVVTHDVPAFRDVATRHGHLSDGFLKWKK